MAPRAGPRPTVAGRIGVALAGGGLMGAAYELGALAALSESIDGLDLAALHVYVGVSAGAFVAAGLANGLSPHAMVRMFVDPHPDDAAFDPAALLRPAWGELRDRLARVPRGIGGIAAETVRGFAQGGLDGAFWRGLDRAASMLPTGVLDATPGEIRLARLLGTDGRSNRFDRLPGALRLVATDIDSGETVAFGAAGTAHVPISRAVSASSAVPGLFPPVRIDGRWYVDGALNKTLHASVALQEGAALVLCINPLVPYGAGADDAPARIAQRGLGAVLAQSVRTALRSRMAVGLEKYRSTHPRADVLLFEPRTDDATTFFTRLFSTSSRRELCEHAYRQTRADLLARSAEIAPVLARHGLSLATDRLTGPAHALVRDPARHPGRARGLAAATRRLDRSLDDLERTLRIHGAV